MNTFNKIGFFNNLNDKRKFSESLDKRSSFQRDRDRILHSNAFRRLAHKTQVFFQINKHDHFRTRLTHSLEVSQISRSINHEFGGNESLTEAISLAHDLGHPPFGHIGEAILNRIMLSEGNNGFDHNVQTLRILTVLEKKYALFDGLNLTFETLDGVLKHSGPIIDLCPSKDNYYNSFIKQYPIMLNKQPSIEAQIASISDDVAYNCHDIDDGIRGGLFAVEDLISIEFIKDILLDNKKKYGKLESSREAHELKRKLIDVLIKDIIDQGTSNLLDYNIKSSSDIFNCQFQVIKFSDSLSENINLIRQFLRQNMYNNNEIVRFTSYIENVVNELFYFYKENLNKLTVKVDIDLLSDKQINRVICDFISGMTDNYAIEKYNEFIYKK